MRLLLQSSLNKVNDFLQSILQQIKNYLERQLGAKCYEAAKNTATNIPQNTRDTLTEILRTVISLVIATAAQKIESLAFKHVSKTLDNNNLTRSLKEMSYEDMLSLFNKIVAVFGEEILEITDLSSLNVNQSTAIKLLVINEGLSIAESKGFTFDMKEFREVFSDVSERLKSLDQGRRSEFIQQLSTVAGSGHIKEIIETVASKPEQIKKLCKGFS